MQNQNELIRRISNIEKLLEERKTKPLNLVEAAKYLSISQSHLYKLTSQRKIPSHKPNGKYLYFFKEELDEWVRTATSERVKGRSDEPENNEEEADDEEPP
ncbi:MAG: helix-turn-helix domain-containing protein [Melioribacteraceae bacterium]|nr:helix-turn-helix domain-containing protein [Melioribacteraceae bacterium]